MLNFLDCMTGEKWMHSWSRASEEELLGLLPFRVGSHMSADGKRSSHNLAQSLLEEINTIPIELVPEMWQSWREWSLNHGLNGCHRN